MLYFIPSSSLIVRAVWVPQQRGKHGSDSQTYNWMDLSCQNQILPLFSDLEGNAWDKEFITRTRFWRIKGKPGWSPETLPHRLKNEVCLPYSSVDGLYSVILFCNGLSHVEIIVSLNSQWLVAQLFRRRTNLIICGCEMFGDLELNRNEVQS